MLSGDAIDQEIAKQVPSSQGGRKTPVDLLDLQLGGGKVLEVLRAHACFKGAGALLFL